MNISKASAEHEVYLGGQSLGDDINDTFCTAEFSMRQLFQPCQIWSWRAYFAQTFTGFAACMMVPTITLGTCTGSILAYLLLFHVRRPGQMHIYATWISLFDLLLLIFVGYFHSLLSFGAPWWGIQIDLFYMRSHFWCKCYQFIRDFIFSGKNLIVFLMVSHIVQQGGVEIPNCTRPTVIHIQIVAVLALSVMISYFAALVHGLHQRAGTFMCAPDPQFDSAVHRFYARHYIILVNGLLPNLGTVCMLWLVWRRLHALELILTYMQRISWSRDPVGLITCYVERRLLDWVRNYRILLYQIGMFSLTRFSQCVVRIVEGWSTRTKIVNSRLNEAITMALINGPVFMEVVLTSFPIIIWCPKFKETRRFHRNFVNMMTFRST
ncbi:hypothetical protein D915_006143 [Fasciola hepatica]|uniref:G-protein coupled receptors family 1 profile domain-containing protein n=1 Tax=Fasciola hepatica TaxID=6192 RepID=A0A4E0RAY7_FASHE|nr:hypothetical protein D915_006143 [Fasciola hepatica]